MSKLLENFRSWKNDFAWPAKGQWLQFFHILTRREKNLLNVFFIFLASGFLIVTGSVYWGYTEVRPDTTGSINAGVIGYPRFLNPALNQVNDADRDLSSVFFSGLMKYDGQGNLINDAAESYAISADGKNYEINLRQNIKWHDGENLTADDVIFTLGVIQNPDYRSPIRSFWQGVQFEKTGDYSLRFSLKNPYASFLNNLTFGILPQHLWKDVAPSQFSLHELNLKPIGSGPYKFVKLSKDTKGNVKSIETEAFGEYFAGEPYISTVTFKFYAEEAEALTAYKKGDIDIFNFISTKNFADLKEKKSPDLSIYPILLPRYFSVFFNQSQNPQLADKNVRLALAYATDKQKIIDEVFDGYAYKVDSPLVPGMTGYTDQVKKYEYSLDQAKKALAAGGWKPNADGIMTKDKKELEITITSVDWPELMQTAQMLKDQWSMLGIKVNLDFKATSSIQSDTIKPRQYQVLLFGEVPGLEPDLFHFWHSSQKKESGLNLSLYENSKVDSLLSAALEDMNKDSRAQRYQQAVNYIIDDLPAIFLFSPDYIVVGQNSIQGVNLKILDLPYSRFSQIGSWFTDTHRTWK